MSFAAMAARLNYAGGAAQQDRMIRQKLKAMLQATRNSYQAARFQRYPGFTTTILGLFNHITQTQDYDTKLISVPWSAKYMVGDVIRWVNTDSYWIIYQQDKEELAYFRGRCRRCDYKIDWVDGHRVRHETYVSIIGPNQPNQLHMLNGMTSTALNLPNANLTMLVTDNEQNHQYFAQHQKFVLKGMSYKVTNVDYFSMPGVIQVYAEQNYSNLIEEDVEEDIDNAWNVKPIIRHHDSEYGIIGPHVIKPLLEVQYEAIVEGGGWVIIENQAPTPRTSLIPAEIVEFETHQRVIHVRWTRPTSGAFTLGYQIPDNNTVYQKHIIVESMM